MVPSGTITSTLGDRREEGKSVRGPKRSIEQSRRDGQRCDCPGNKERDSRRSGWSTES